MRIRPFVIAAALAMTTALTGCMTDGFLYTANYGATSDAGYSLPAVPITKVPQEFRRTIINLDTPEKPGTIIVDTGTKHLYFILPEGKAVRYGIGVGREGFEWHGTARIAVKREWPVWTPPPAMIRRKPELAKWRGGMPPGPPVLQTLVAEIYGPNEESRLALANRVIKVFKSTLVHCNIDF